MIKVPVIDRDAKYASGLTLFEHQKAIKHHKATIGKVADSKGLMKARRDLELRMMEFHKRHRKYEPAKALAKFIRSDAAKPGCPGSWNWHRRSGRYAYRLFQPEVATPAPKLSDHRRSLVPNSEEVTQEVQTPPSSDGDTTDGERPAEQAQQESEPNQEHGDDRDPDFDKPDF